MSRAGLEQPTGNSKILQGTGPDSASQFRKKIVGGHCIAAGGDHSARHESGQPWDHAYLPTVIGRDAEDS